MTENRLHLLVPRDVIKPHCRHQVRLQGDRVDQGRTEAADSLEMTLIGIKDHHCLLLALIIPEMGHCESGLRHSTCVINTLSIL